jgi:hypothetical protein
MKSKDPLQMSVAELTEAEVAFREMEARREADRIWSRFSDPAFLLQTVSLIRDELLRRDPNLNQP